MHAHNFAHLNQIPFLIFVYFVYVTEIGENLIRNGILAFCGIPNVLRNSTQVASSRKKNVHGFLFDTFSNSVETWPSVNILLVLENELTDAVLRQYLLPLALQESANKNLFLFHFLFHFYFAPSPNQYQTFACPHSLQMISHNSFGSYASAQWLVNQPIHFKVETIIKHFVDKYSSKFSQFHSKYSQFPSWKLWTWTISGKFG